MNDQRRKRLEAAGYSVYDDAGEWLGLSDEDRRVIAMHAAVGRAVAARRAAAGLSQQALADKIGSSQSRVAKVEAGHPGVSLDLAFRCLFAVGGGLADLTDLTPAAGPMKANGKTADKPRAVPARRRSPAG